MGRLIIFYCLFAITFSLQLNSQSFSSRLFQYQEKVLKVGRIEVLVNQPKYTNGDTIHLQVLQLDEKNQLLKGRQNVTVALVDSKGTVVDDIRFFLVNGVAGNQLFIPNSASPGYYRLVAYTSEMSYLPSSFRFELMLPVVADSSLILDRFETLSIQESQFLKLIDDKITLKGSQQIGMGGFVLTSIGNNLIKSYSFAELMEASKHIPLGVYQTFVTVLDSEGKRLETLHLVKDLNVALWLKDTIKVRSGESVDLSIKMDNAQDSLLAIANLSVYQSGLYGQADQSIYFDPNQLVSDIVTYLPREISSDKTLMSIRGVALDFLTNQALSQGTVIYYYLQNQTMRYKTILGYGGAFDFQTLDFYGDEEILAVTIDQYGKQIPVTLTLDEVEADLKQSTDVAYNTTNTSDLYGAYIRKKRLIDESYKAFTQPIYMDTTFRISDKFEKKIAQPDILINVQEYVNFSSLGLLLKEVIRPVYYGVKKGVEVVRVKYLPSGLAKDDPVYVIDGKATYDTKYFLSIPTSNIETLGIINNDRKLSRFGPMGLNGIIIIHTKGGLYAPTPKSTCFVQGLSRYISFEVSNGLGSRAVPTFRAGVYWNPMKTGSSSYASDQVLMSDDAVDFIKNVRGYLSDGKPVNRFQIIQNH
ncbi:MAG: hypothetical protein ACI9DM_000905 [Cyclobacteriaceae bacterium]|jgi:hypothetical protein